MRRAPDPELPSWDPDEAWLVRLDGLDELHAAALGCLVDGTIGVPGDTEDLAHGTDRTVFVSGAFSAGADGWERPLPGPALTGLAPCAASVAAADVRVLDLRSGMLHRRRAGGGPDTVRLVSLARPGLLVMRATGMAARLPRPAPLGPPVVANASLAAEHTVWIEQADGADDVHIAATTGDRAQVVAAARQLVSTDRGGVTVDRVVAVAGGPSPDRDALLGRLAEAAQVGVDGLITEHTDVWRRRWQAADLVIGGDERAQQAIRFALFHLLSCAPSSGEALVGARGLTGLAYAGRVFWDTDVFVLPVLAATWPRAARAMVEYRLRRLPAARRLARARGHAGARYPWESAETGEDVTPTSVVGLDGRPVPIWTGLRQEHITADVAWGAACYASWTGEDPMHGPAGDLLGETARYWASRASVDADGTAHLRDVIGPDEYHELVDDNAYTNGMARWNLRAAASQAHASEADARAWRALADELVTGYDPALGRHHQFTGFDDLEPLLIGEVADAPIAADVLLGRRRVAGAQVIKQPDVLMLHHTLPDDVPAGSLAHDLDHYLPRTAHGSSLSPAICAGLLARAGRPDEAMPLFDLAARLDLDDLTGSAAAGLHLATMGGLWQALVGGFAGIRPVGGRLRIDPHLPGRWTHLDIRLRFRGTPVAITVAHDHVTVRAPRPVPLLIGGRAATAPTTVVLRDADRGVRHA